MQLCLRFEYGLNAALTPDRPAVAVDLEAADAPLGAQAMQYLRHHVGDAAHRKRIRKGCPQGDEPAMAALQVPWIVVGLVDHGDVLWQRHVSPPSRPRTPTLAALGSRDSPAMHFSSSRLRYPVGWDVSLARPLGRATAPTFPVRSALLTQGPPVGVRLGRTIAIIAKVVFILRSAQLAVVRPVAVRAMRPLIMAPAVAAMRMTRALTFGISIVAVAPLRRWSRLLGKILVGRRRQHRDAPVGEPLDALELAALTAVAEGDGDARGAG